jgi:hypothetical protein
MVASATRSPPPTSIITGCETSQASAKYSVWPGCGNMSAGMNSLQIGPVQTASAMSDASMSIAQSRYVAARNPDIALGLPGLMPSR